MKAPKGYTNQPSRKVSAYVAPYQEAWLRDAAAKLFPGAPKTGPRSAVSRFLRLLVMRAMVRAEDYTLD